MQWEKNFLGSRYFRFYDSDFHKTIALFYCSSLVLCKELHGYAYRLQEFSACCVDIQYPDCSNRWRWWQKRFGGLSRCIWKYYTGTCRIFTFFDYEGIKTFCTWILAFFPVTILKKNQKLKIQKCLHVLFTVSFTFPFASFVNYM